MTLTGIPKDVTSGISIVVTEVTAPPTTLIREAPADLVKKISYEAAIIAGTNSNSGAISFSALPTTQITYNVLWNGAIIESGVTLAVSSTVTETGAAQCASAPSHVFPIARVSGFKKISCASPAISSGIGFTFQLVGTGGSTYSQTATTDASGRYFFYAPSGKYQLTEIGQPAGFAPPASNAPRDITVSSTADVAVDDYVNSPYVQLNFAANYQAQNMATAGVKLQWTCNGKTVNFDGISGSQVQNLVAGDSCTVKVLAADQQECPPKF